MRYSVIFCTRAQMLSPEVSTVGCGMAETIFYVADQHLSIFGMTYNYLFITVGACMYEPGIPELVMPYFLPPPLPNYADQLPAASSDLQPQGQCKLF